MNFADFPENSNGFMEIINFEGAQTTPQITASWSFLVHSGGSPMKWCQGVRLGAPVLTHGSQDDGGYTNSLKKVGGSILTSLKEF